MVETTHFNDHTTRRCRDGLRGQPPDVVVSDKGGNTAMGTNALASSNLGLGGTLNTAAGLEGGPEAA